MEVRPITSISLASALLNEITARETANRDDLTMRRLDEIRSLTTILSAFFAPSFFTLSGLLIRSRISQPSPWRAPAAEPMPTLHVLVKPTTRRVRPVMRADQP